MLKSKQYHYRTYLSLIMELFVHSELKMLEDKKNVEFLSLFSFKPNQNQETLNQIKWKAIANEHVWKMPQKFTS